MFLTNPCSENNEISTLLEFSVDKFEAWATVSLLQAEAVIAIATKPTIDTLALRLYLLANGESLNQESPSSTTVSE